MHASFLFVLATTVVTLQNLRLSTPNFDVFSFHLLAFSIGCQWTFSAFVNIVKYFVIITVYSYHAMQRKIFITSTTTIPLLQQSKPLSLSMLLYGNTNNKLLLRTSLHRIQLIIFHSNNILYNNISYAYCLCDPRKLQNYIFATR